MSGKPVIQSLPVPGFFGKVPSHGDFVSRRLPPQFINEWDSWLRRGLHAGADQYREAWRQIFMTGPVWRFALAGGLCGEVAWTGVLLPSVDRVGRIFPLSIACGFRGAIAACWRGNQDWYEQIEGIASQVFEPGFCLGEMSEALLRLPFGPIDQSVCAIPEYGKMSVIPECPPSASVNVQPPVSPRGTGKSAAINSLWWSQEAAKVAVLGCTGLPAPGMFASLFDGVWGRRGWEILDA